MQGWIEGFQESIDFIEQNLSQTLDMEMIAEKAVLSSFWYTSFHLMVERKKIGNVITTLPDM